VTKHDGLTGYPAGPFSFAAYQSVSFDAYLPRLQFVQGGKTNGEFNGGFVHRTYLSVIRRFVRVAR
jgi:hypothetical protein